MRVGIASLQDPASPGTWSGVPFNLAPALERQGIEVVLHGVRSNLPGRLGGYLAYQLRLRGLSPTRWSDPRLGVRRSLLFGRSDYLRLRSVRARHARNLRRATAAADVDRVLHMGSLTLPLEAEPEVEHFLVCDATWHTVTADAVRDASFSDGLAGRFEELEREVFAGVSHFFALSEHVASDLRTHYGIEPERVTVVGSGPGWIEPFDGAKDYGNRELLFVCKERFEEKGGRLLLEAFVLASQRVDGLKLTMVSEREHGSMPGVAWRTGLGQGPELAELFRRASVYAMPALIDPWGLVYLEALASKTPILGLRRHAFPEFAGNGAYGFVVDEATPEAVAESLVDATSDPERLRRMGEKGQRHCLETYSWDRVAERIAGVLPAVGGRAGQRTEAQRDRKRWRPWRPRLPQSYAEQTHANPYWLIRYPHRRRFEAACDLLLDARPRVLFDYGAGDGEMLARLLEDPRAESIELAIAYDPTPRQFEVALERLAPWADRAKVVTDPGDAEEALGGRSVDTVACLEVLEHLSWGERQRFYEFCSEYLVECGLCVIDVPVEIGPALLVKEFGRRVLKGRPASYTTRELLRPTFGLRVRDPERFDEKRVEGWVQDHKGFDYRELRDELPDWMPVERIKPTPVGALPPWLCNQEVLLVARKAEADSSLASSS